jgi:hypothetical protein
MKRQQQMALQFTRQHATEAVWDQLAESYQQQMIQLYARLIATAARSQSDPQTMEKIDVHANH